MIEIVKSSRQYFYFKEKCVNTLGQFMDKLSDLGGLQTLASVLFTTETFRLNQHRSWTIICLFTVIGGLVNFQWVQFLSVREISKLYFGVSDSAVTWTGNVTSLMFVVVVLPVTILFDTVKLRTTLLVAGSLNAVGTLVKAASTNNYFGMIIGQCLGKTSI